jgi:hypothetical protein
MKSQPKKPSGSIKTLAGLGRAAQKRLLQTEQLQAVLRSILLAINGAEGCAVLSDRRSHAVSDSLREALYYFRASLEEHGDFQKNAALEAFDSTFRDCGWDDQGLRWEASPDNQDDPHAIWVVEFSNEERTVWHVI